LSSLDELVLDRFRSSGVIPKPNVGCSIPSGGHNLVVTVCRRVMTRAVSPSQRCLGLQATLRAVRRTTLGSRSGIASDPRWLPCRARSPARSRVPPEIVDHMRMVYGNVGHALFELLDRIAPLL